MAGIPSVEARLITGEELARMPDLGPCELIDGKIVPMTPTSPEHGRVEVNAAALLKAWAQTRRAGGVLAGEVGIYTQRNPDRVRGADVVFISDERYARRDPQRGYLDVAPELIIEVLSPDDRVIGLTEKLREYFAIGVTLVWVLDPFGRRVYAYRAPTELREYADTDTLTAPDVLPGFEVLAARLFDD
jgi:Uma2 family endonuclease